MSELDRQVAEAMGLNFFIARDGKSTVYLNMNYIKPVPFNGTLSSSEVKAVRYSPSTNWQQCGELIEKYHISLEHSMFPFGDNYWQAIIYGKDSPRFVDSCGKTPQEAVCKAVIALHKGEGDE